MANKIEKNIGYQMREQALMTRYAASYAKKSGEKPLSSEVVSEIIESIFAVGAAFISANPLNILNAVRALVRLATKYGSVVWKMYDNYRKRQRRQEKAQENLSQKKRQTLPPTQRKLQQILASHEMSAQKGALQMPYSDHVA